MKECIRKFDKTLSIKSNKTQLVIMKEENEKMYTSKKDSLSY